MNESQFLKGILEGCVLRRLEYGSKYGYEFVDELEQYGISVTQGTIYPLLLRLERNELVVSAFKPSKMGPSRKYYTLTPKGEESLQRFKASWQSLSLAVNKIMEETT